LVPRIPSIDFNVSVPIVASPVTVPAAMWTVMPAVVVVSLL